MSVGRLFTILVSAFLCACTADLVDAPPSAPLSPSPADSASNQATNLQLRWQAGDGDGANTSYDVYLATARPLYTVARGLKRPSFRPEYRLQRNTTYFWQVVTFNGSGIAKSDVWTFTTGIGNNPDVPVNTWPVNGSDHTAENIALRWTGSDADNDTLVYDVYLGRDTSPPLAAMGLTENGFSSQIRELGTYYWRVVARDRFGLMTEGPTWSFHAVGIPGHVYTWGGTGTAGGGAMGQPPRETELYWPVDVSFSQGGTPFVVDWNNHRIIAPDASGHFSLVAGGIFGDPCLFAPPGCQNIVAAGSELNQPSDVVFDADGNIVLSAWHNSNLFLIDKNTGLMDRFCGTGTRSFSPDGEPAATTLTNLVASAAFDSQGRLYYTDQTNMVIRMIDENGIVHTVAGTNPVWNPGQSVWVPQSGYGGDEGPATSALFNFDHGQFAMPSGKICFDAEDNMYIADTGNRCVRKVDSSGIIHLFDGLPESSSGSYVEPRDVAVDNDGNVFVVDSALGMIYMVLPNGSGSRIAGRYGDYPPGEMDGVKAEDAKFDGPMGIALDAHGNVWIADTRHSRIRVLYQ